MDENFITAAEKHIEAEVRAGIERAKIQPARPKGFVGLCACGQEVPPARVALGYFRCIACASKRP